LGEVASDRGDYALARALMEESLALFRQVGDMWCTVEMLEQLARLAALEGQGTPALDNTRRAVQIYGAAEALRAAIGAPLPPHHSAAYHAPILAAARAQLGAEAFGAAWRAGRTLTLEQAIALATTAPHHPPAPEQARLALVADAGGAPVTADRDRRDTSADLADLSAREREVLRLVAEGLTDAQVALKLTISPRTVQRHLSSIYSKLQVTSRTAAARLAIAQGLG
jgi:DNA-binding CsgD family transcriptional regulator